ncbi:MAG: MarR family transcriptional regulator [Gemmatimonadaceae bacterium]|nr:MarR family transcriptional regulator [Gemmatimonadaceae bacterium]
MQPAPMTSRHRLLLDALKRRGRATVPQLADELALNIETVRDHLKTLVARDLVRREPASRHGPGRPEIAYALTDASEVLFPRREGEILRELGTYLVQHGNEQLLRDFFSGYIDRRRHEAAERVAHLEGRERIDEVARIFSELGFMPVVQETNDGPRLRLCHCPLRDLVSATRIPCRAEIGFLAELLETRLTRVSYIPEGDDSCSYEVARATC